MRDGMAKTLGRRMLSPILGRPRLQSLFQDMYEVSLAGLGYGEGANLLTSGERGVLNYVDSQLRDKRRVTVFDVGANVGQYAECVLDRWGDRVDLWCFEPSPSTYEVLSQRLNGRARVTLENLGLSDQSGTVTLHTLGEGSKLASIHERRGIPLELNRSEAIEVCRLDAYCAEHRIATLDYLKLDVEGHELSVLQGAETMLASGAIRFIQFEFGAACIDARVFFRDYWDVLGQDYLLFRVLAHGLAPITTYDHTLEIFKRATNYLAERR